MEEKQGPSKLAGDAGIEDNDDDAQDNHNEDHNSYYPDSPALTVQAIFPSEKIGFEKRKLKNRTNKGNSWAKKI